MAVAEIERSTDVRNAGKKDAITRKTKKCNSAECCNDSSSKSSKKKSTSGDHNKELGRRGEDAAARFLDRRGYEILARNWSCFAGEADIVAQDGMNIVFVEVKTRKDCQKGFPAEAVNRQKRERYEKIALAYLQENEVGDMTVRFDVVSIVVVAPNRALIRHHINAFAAA